MRDLSYDQALVAAPETHVVLLGPVACHFCGEPVEWAGVAWLEPGSLSTHRCKRARDRADDVPMAHQVRVLVAVMPAWASRVGSIATAVVAVALVLAIAWALVRP